MEKIVEQTNERKNGKKKNTHKHTHTDRPTNKQTYTQHQTNKLTNKFKKICFQISTNISCIAKKSMSFLVVNNCLWNCNIQHCLLITISKRLWERERHKERRWDALFCKLSKTSFWTFWIYFYEYFFENLPVICLSIFSHSYEYPTMYTCILLKGQRSSISSDELPLKSVVFT